MPFMNMVQITKIFYHREPIPTNTNFFLINSVDGKDKFT